MQDKQTVLITGGTSGIGLAAARLFLERGCNIIVNGRSEARGKRALEKLRSCGGAVAFIAADVATTDGRQNLVKEAVRSFGGLDVLVNSAGIYFEKAIEDMKEEDFNAIMAVNVKGTYFMCRECAPYLKRRGGAIVNVSSDAGLNGNFFCSAYCASKGAVTVFSKALALELAPHGVRVNCVCPGDIDTPLTRGQLTKGHEKEELEAMARHYPIGRIGTAEEAAKVIVFLALDASFAVGAAWSVDGGLTAY